MKFLKLANSNIQICEYSINSNMKAIVSEYYTVEVIESEYESHKYVIDIQYPIIGAERIKLFPIQNGSENSL